jgi:hypothetical protein
MQKIWAQTRSIGVQFDSSEISYMTELLAYGTAVVVEKETERTSPVRLG